MRQARLALVSLLTGLAALAGAAHAHARVENVSNTPGLAEGEETAAVNPTDPRNVIVGSNQWQPNPGESGNVGAGPEGFTTCAVWSSHDGGRSWKGGRLEETGLGQNQPGAGQPPTRIPGEFAGDPDAGNVISADQNTVFDRRGNAYYQCINFGARTGDVIVYVYRSGDGGRTWDKPVAAFRESDTRIQIDRSFLAIDDSGGSRDGTLYLAWETMFYQAYLPEVYVRKSTDGGRTWGPVVRVDKNDNRAQWDPRQYPVVGPDGTLYVVYDAATLVSPTPLDPQLTPLKIIVGRSTDGGQGFEESVVEPSVNRIQSPDEAFSYFTETISAIAVDPAHRGRLAVAWPDDRSGEARILMRYSKDGGRSWSGIVDVADDPPGRGNQHDHAGLTYLPDGRLVAVWRDRRNDGGAFGKKFDVFARVFDVSGSGALTPGDTVRVTESPQPDGQNTHGSMPTEYLGVTSDRTGVRISWDEMRGRFLDNVYKTVPLSALGGAGTGTRCVPRRLRVSGRRIGPARLGGSFRAFSRRHRAVRRKKQATRFCVRGGGRFWVGSRRGKIDFVATTARGHRTRRTGPGRRVRRRIGGARRLGRGLQVGYRMGGGRVIYGVRKRRIRFLAVVTRRQSRHRRTLVRRLRALGLVRKPGRRR